MNSDTRIQPDARHQLKSKIKEVAGMISDSPRLRSRGTGETPPGTVRIKIGQFNQFWGK